MLKLTKTESIIFEALKDWAKTKYDLEWLVDHWKDYSESFIKVLVSNINRKAWKRIIEWFNESGFYKYRLVDDAIEYKIAQWIEWILEEIREMRTLDKKIACETCAFKANYNNRWKYIFIYIALALVLMSLWYLIWHDRGFKDWLNSAETQVNLYYDDIQKMIE